jgi:hypothetical protein
MSVTPSTTNSASTAAQAQPTLTPSEWAGNHAMSLKQSKHKELDLIDLLLKNPMRLDTTLPMLHAALAKQRCTICQATLRSALTTAQTSPGSALIEWVQEHAMSLGSSNHQELELTDLLLEHRTHPAFTVATPAMLHAALARNGIRILRAVVSNALIAVQVEPGEELIKWAETYATPLASSKSKQRKLTALLREHSPPKDTTLPMLHAALVQNGIPITRTAVNQARAPSRVQPNQALDKWVETSNAKSLAGSKHGERELAALLRRHKLPPGTTATILNATLVRHYIDIARPSVNNAWIVAQALPDPALVELAKGYQSTGDMRQRYDLTVLLRRHGLPLPRGTTDVTLQAALIDAGTLIDRHTTQLALGAVQTGSDDDNIFHRSPPIRTARQAGPAPAIAFASIRNSPGTPPASAQEVMSWVEEYLMPLMRTGSLTQILTLAVAEQELPLGTTAEMLQAALEKKGVPHAGETVRKAWIIAHAKVDENLKQWIQGHLPSLTKSDKLAQNLQDVVAKYKPPKGTTAAMLHAALIRAHFFVGSSAARGAYAIAYAEPDRAPNDWVKAHQATLTELDKRELERDLTALLLRDPVAQDIPPAELQAALARSNIFICIHTLQIALHTARSPALIRWAQDHRASLANACRSNQKLTELLRQDPVPADTTAEMLRAALSQVNIVVELRMAKKALALARAEPTPDQMHWVQDHLPSLTKSGKFAQNLQEVVAKYRPPDGTTAGMLHAALAKKNIIVGLRAVKIALPPQPPRHDDAGFLPPSSRPRQKRTAAQANLATPAASITRARDPSGSLASSPAISFNPGARAPGLEEWGDLLDRERPSSTFSAISEFPLGDEVERFMAGSPTPSVDSPEVEDEWASLLQSLVRNEPSSPPFSIASHPSFSTGPDNGRFMMESPLNLRTPYAAGPSAVNPFAPVPGVHPHPVADPFIQPLPLAPLDRDGSADELPRKVLPPRLSAIRFSQVAQRQPGESEHGLIVRVHETHRELSDSDLARALGVPWESVSEAILRDELLRQFNLSAIPEPGAAHAGSAPDPEACKQTDTRLAHTCREQGLKAITNVGLSQHKDGDLVLAWNANDRRQPVVEVRLPRPSLSSASAEPPTSPVASTPQTPTDRLQAELFRELGLSNIEGVSAGYTVPGRDRDLQGARAALAADLAQACQEQKLAAITNVYWSQRTGVVLAWDDNDPSRRVATVRWESPTAELGGRKTS